LWLQIIFKGLWLLITPNSYFQILVLEMGVDRPGDMDYLLSIARPDISVITTIGISHYEFFQTPEAIEQEKGKIAEGLRAGGTLILNADDPAAFRQKSKTREQIISYGLNAAANIKVSGLTENFENFSTSLKIHTPSREFTATINAISRTHISSVLAAVSVAEVLEIETDLLQKGLKEYKPAPGRLNLIAGIKHSIIIDDTYNSAPASAEAALDILAKIPKSYKIAILGDMLELGEKSVEEHEKIGKLAADIGIQKLITIGPGGKTIAAAAIAGGLDSDHVVSFESSTESLRAIQNMLVPDSAVLIKGSQGMRMEKITKEIMAEPMRAKELLCRQDESWLTT